MTTMPSRTSSLFLRGCRDDRYSVRHWFQNCSAKYCTLPQRLLEHRSSFERSPGGGNMGSGLMGKRWLGVKGTGAEELSRVSAQGGLLTIAATSEQRVGRETDVSPVPCSLGSPSITALVLGMRGRFAFLCSSGCSRDLLRTHLWITAEATLSAPQPRTLDVGRAHVPGLP